MTRYQCMSTYIMSLHKCHDTNICQNMTNVTTQMSSVYAKTQTCVKSKTLKNLNRPVHINTLDKSPLYDHRQPRNTKAGHSSPCHALLLTTPLEGDTCHTWPGTLATNQLHVPPQPSTRAVCEMCLRRRAEDGEHRLFMFCVAVNQQL